MPRSDVKTWTGRLADLVVGLDGTHPTLDQLSGVYVTVPYNSAAARVIIERIDELDLPYEVRGRLLLMGDADLLDRFSAAS